MTARMTLATLCCLALMTNPTIVAAQNADTIFTGGKVYTVDDQQPWAEAVAVKGNKIIFVGSAADAKKHIGDKTQVIDCEGKTIMPGFISCHDHLIAADWTNDGVNLIDAKDLDDCLRLIKEYADAHPDEKVIKGKGWNRGKFGGKNPTATQLDSVVSDRPAIILDFSIHDAWLNTKALKMGKVTKDTPDTLPGITYWVRDEEGNPTGCAVEIQWMQTYIDIGAWDAEKMIRASTEEMFSLAAKNGTTMIQNPGIVTPNIKDVHGGMEQDFRLSMKILQDMEKKGELKLRVRPCPVFKSAVGDPTKFAAFALDMSKQYTNDKLKVISTKIHPDGNWNAENSPFLEPYETGKRGGYNVKPELIKKVLIACNKVGLDVVMHTDGDATVRAVVDAVEATREQGHSDKRNSIHHLPWCHPDDYQRIVKLKIPVNATPAFTNDWSNQDSDGLRLLGKERVMKHMGRYTDLPNDGVNLSLSADVPSTPPSMQAPLFNAEVACTLMDPTTPNDTKPFPPTRKPLSVEQAIRAMTIDAAWQLRMENKLGSLEVGKLADIVVLSGNPFEVNPTEIAEIAVYKTMMDGKFTYGAK